MISWRWDIYFQLLSYIGTYVCPLWIKPKMCIAPDLVLTIVNSRFWGKSLRTASNRGYVSRIFFQFLSVCNSEISWTKSYVFVFNISLGIFIPCVHPVAFEIQHFWTQGYINADLGGVSKLTYSYKRNYKESQRK